MKYVLTWVYIFCLISFRGHAHPYISNADLERAQPYLLPEHFPVKQGLDRLFRRSHVLLSVETMKKAGFINPLPRKYTHVIVTKNKKFPGYVFKVYLDSQRYFDGQTELDYWLLRIHGVEVLNTAIQTFGYEHLFKAPKKWIYQLPADAVHDSDYLKRNFILVEEDMQLLSTEENNAKWQSAAVTPELLVAFFQILEETGLHDCAKPDNAPFSIDGKIAFIDTQTFHSWPVNYQKMTKCLPKSLRNFWKELVKNKKK